MVDAKDFYNKHKGERCFVIGTGPSLNKIDLDLMDNDVTFGCNNYYKTGKVPTYYGISDFSVWRDLRHELKNIDSQFFLADGAARKRLRVSMMREPVILQARLRQKFQVNLHTGPVYIGRTVVYDVCLQVCYYMGFSEVYLVGLDCDYSGVHHFDGSRAACIYFGAAGEWRQPFAAFRLARNAFEADGRKIYNATKGGKLEIFERVDYESLFDQ